MHCTSVAHYGTVIFSNVRTAFFLHAVSSTLSKRNTEVNDSDGGAPQFIEILRRRDGGDGRDGMPGNHGPPGMIGPG